jgi:hypothetical protein
VVTFLSARFEGFVLLGRWSSIAKACSFEMDVCFEHSYWWNMGHSNCQAKFLLEVLDHSSLMTSICALSIFKVWNLWTRCPISSHVLRLVLSGASHILLERTMAWESWTLICSVHGFHVTLVHSSKAWTWTRSVEDCLVTSVWII